MVLRYPDIESQRDPPDGHVDHHHLALHSPLAMSAEEQMRLAGTEEKGSGLPQDIYGEVHERARNHRWAW